MNEDELIKDFTELQIECSKLKELLKECIEELKDFNNSSYPTVKNLLTRINAAIGESEE